MEVTINYEGKEQFQVKARSHTILSDQPHKNGGDDTGMTPTEIFLASLGSCAGFYAVKYLQTREIDATGLKIDVSAEKATHPLRLEEIAIHLSLPTSLDDLHYAGVEKAMQSCLIHNTLTHPPKITTQISAGFIAQVGAQS
jgi:putative redox protein